MKNDSRSATVPDEELVAQARAGSSWALSELVERHHAVVYRVVLGILGDTDDAADATQEVFLKAIRALDRFRGDASVRTWLLAISANEARGVARRRGRRREDSLDDTGELPSRGPDASGEVMRTEELERVRDLLSRLPEKQRLAVQLRTQEGLSFREVGEVIGSTEGAARVTYHHGIRRLREMLS